MRHVVLSRSAAAGGALLIGLAGLAAAAPASAATAGHVDIRVELDVVDAGGNSVRSGPAVFEVTDAAIGAGPELTGADLIDNPSEWCGNLTVDVDPDARTITVAAEDDCSFTDVRVWVSSPEFTSVTLVSDDLLWPSNQPTGAPTVGLGTGGVGPGGVAAMAVPVPRAAPGSLATLTQSFTAPQLTAAWHVDQSGLEGGVRTETLAGSAVWTYTTGLPTTGAADPAPLLLGAGALMLAGAAALVVVARRREQA